MPSLQRLYQEVDDEDFDIVAISVDAPFGETDSFGRVGGDLHRYADSLGLTFSILHDPSGKVQQTFQTTGIPESFVVDQNGVIYKKVAGATVWDAPQNVQLVRRLLEE
jgi:peroxiredoxin